MKKIILLFCFLSCSVLKSQTLFSESFAALSLSSYTTANASVLYTTVPTGFDLINDGNHNSSSSNNTPFNVPGLKTSGWALYYNSIENDTFLVSTSWLDTAQAVNCWIITPSVANISANTVFTWLAKSPDPAFPESYELYATNKTGTLTANDFTIGDRLLVVSEEKNGWTRHSVNLSSFAGQSLRFAFKNISNDKFQIWIDDLSVLTLTNATDASLQSLNANKYFLTNTNQALSVNIKNNGASAINAITLNYTYGTSSPVSNTFTFNALGYAESLKLSIPQTYVISTPGNYPVKVWLSAPNNTADQNTGNDSLSLNVTAQLSSPQKTLLIEQFVSAMNGESVDAQEKLKSLESNSVVVVNVHDNDSLREDNSSGILAWKKNYATAVIDRAYDDSLVTFAITRYYYANRIQKQLSSVTPASVSIINKAYNAITRELSFTVKADFIGDAKGDYRFNAYLTERHVHGTTGDTTVNGYNQLSNYYNVPWSPYFQTGYYSSVYATWVLKPTQYKHHNTLIHSFDQSFGSSGVIPQNGGTAGQSYQQTFTMTLPASTSNVSLFNADNIYIVGFVTENGNTVAEKRIINAAQEKLNSNSEIVGITNRFNYQASIYPNPAGDVTYVLLPAVEESASVKVFDLGGKLCLKQVFEGTNILEVKTKTLDAGVFILEVGTEQSTSRIKLVIKR